jgi:hypothetical protein
VVEAATAAARWEDVAAATEVSQHGSR